VRALSRFQGGDKDERSEEYDQMAADSFVIALGRRTWRVLFVL